jgi:hypothetical protein
MGRAEPKRGRRGGAKHRHEVTRREGSVTMTPPTITPSPPFSQATERGATAKTTNTVTAVKSRGATLSILWIFATLNFIYCDVVTVMDPIKHSPIQLTQGFLLGASVLVEIPIAMVLLSWILKYGPNRWANIIAGVIMTVVQAMSLVVAVPTMYYVFFSVIEIACTAFIVWYAWTWANPGLKEK